jgi:hypothetical protein
LNGKRLQLGLVLFILLGNMGVGNVARAVVLPGGKAFFNVVLTSVPKCPDNPDTSVDVCQGAPPYWVRLANYHFSASTGTVNESFWFWNQSTQSLTGRTNITTAGCALNCYVHTPFGYEDHTVSGTRPYPKTLSGTFNVIGSTLTIVWNDAGASSETWTVSNPIPSLAKLTFVSSTYGARTAYGFGSNRSNNDTDAPDASMQVINDMNRNYSGYTVSNNGDDASNSNSSSTAGLNFSSNNWLTCSASCIHVFVNAGGSCGNQYFALGQSSANHRKNFLEHYCEGSSPAQCPKPPLNPAGGWGSGGTQHPHVKALWQVVDDNAVFRGWVAAEASLYEPVPSIGNYLGAAYYVNLA